jgi:hypothetical protein
MGRWLLIICGLMTAVVGVTAWYFDSVISDFQPGPFPPIATDLPFSEARASIFNQRLLERFPLESPAVIMINDLQREGFASLNVPGDQIYLRFDRARSFLIQESFIVRARADANGALTELQGINALTGP